MKSTQKTGTFLKRFALGILLAAVVAVPLGLFIGCSNNPLSTDPNTSIGGSYFDQTYVEGSVESFAASKSNSGGSRFSEVYEVYSGDGEVNAVDGGSVSLSGGSYEFEVPAASISENTIISVAIVSFVYNGKNLTLFEFSPDGLQFDPSATLRIDANGLNSRSKSFRLFWLNPLTKRWEFQESKRSDVNGVVSFSIDHFSKYGVE